MRYYSRKDRWLAILIWGTIIGPLILSIHSLIRKEISMIEAIIMLSVFLIIGVFLLWLWYTTYYVIEEECLIIKYGPFKKVIKLNSITSIQKTSNPLSGPALSLKRIEIMYNNYNMTLISPENRDHFIILLLNKCPNAEVKNEVGFLKDRK